MKCLSGSRAGSFLQLNHVQGGLWFWHGGSGLTEVDFEQVHIESSNWAPNPVYLAIAAAGFGFLALVATGLGQPVMGSWILVVPLLSLAALAAGWASPRWRYTVRLSSPGRQDLRLRMGEAELCRIARAIEDSRGSEDLVEPTGTGELTDRED
ncbi:MAG: hypothetical protein AAF196_12400 [Planctomycetota bacterium]